MDRNLVLALASAALLLTAGCAQQEHRSQRPRPRLPAQCERRTQLAPATT